MYMHVSTACVYIYIHIYIYIHMYTSNSVLSNKAPILSPHVNLFRLSIAELYVFPRSGVVLSFLTLYHVSVYALL